MLQSSNQIKDQKDQLRRSFLERRLSLKARQIAATRYGFLTHLQWLISKQFQTKDVCTFVPFRKEPPIHELWDLLPHINWWVPTVDSKNFAMEFIKVDSQTDWKLNSYGIREPKSYRKQRLRPTQATMVLVPALSVDIGGQRLGYGAGYYDRWLASQAHVQTVAIIYDQFLVPSLPHAPHDRAVEWICTERRLLRVEDGFSLCLDRR